MAAEKEVPVYCLFHQKTDCICIHAVVAKKKLVERLEGAIRLATRQNKFSSDEDENSRRRGEIEVWRDRLAAENEIE